MPTITVDIENTEETVTRRVVRDIVYDLISAMGMPYDVAVLYPGASDEQDLPIAIHDSQALPAYDPKSKIIVTAEEEYVSETVPTSRFTADENSPLFHDPVLGVIVAPNYVRTRLRLNLKWRFKTESLARTFIADVRRQASLFRDGLFHEVSYQYLFPPVPLLILTRIHTLREQQGGYGQDLVPYLREHFSDQLVIHSNRSDTQRSWFKEETQTGILGTYDFEVVPEKPEAGQSKTTHIVSFDYTLQYDKILAATMRYPILIHNQDLGSDFYDTHVPFELGHRLTLPSQTRAHLDQFTNNQYVTGFRNGAPVPQFMDWQPTHPIPGMEGLLRLIIMANPDTPRTVFNLLELGPLELKPWLVEYATQEYAHLTTLRDSGLFVQLYENDAPVDGSRLQMDADLNLTTTFDLDVRKRYHVWVALVSDLRFLTKTARSRLLKRGDWASIYLRSLDPKLTTNLDPTSDGSLSQQKFDTAVHRLTTRKVPVVNEARLVNFRLANFLLIAR